MFTKAYTLLSEETWEKAPSTNNPVESINKQSIPEKGNSLEPLLENIYREDRVQAAKVVAAGKNVSLSYRDDSEEARGRRNDNRRRKRRFHAAKEDGRESSENAEFLVISIGIAQVSSLPKFLDLSICLKDSSDGKIDG